jgi:hypothetical protein
MAQITPKLNNEGIPNYYGGISPSGSIPAPQQGNETYTKHHFNGTQLTSYPQMSEYRQAKPARVKPDRNGLIAFAIAIATMVFICKVPFLGVGLATVGLILGHKSINDTKGEEFKIRSFGIYGTISGIVALLLSIFWTVIFVASAIEKIMETLQ